MRLQSHCLIWCLREMTTASEHQRQQSFGSIWAALFLFPKPHCLLQPSYVVSFLTCSKFSQCNICHLMFPPLCCSSLTQVFLIRYFWLAVYWTCFYYPAQGSRWVHLCVRVCVGLKTRCKGRESDGCIYQNKVFCWCLRTFHSRYIYISAIKNTNWVAALERF